MTTQRSAPTPRVDHLPTILRGILTGKIRAPAFQREFVWKKAQVLELLESVARGFPIGSVLLWKVEGEAIKQAREGSTPFPELPPAHTYSAVLDGLQRLSVLFGVIHAPHGINNDIFRVGYDLRDGEFFHIEGPEAELPRHRIPLSVLSDPRHLIKSQADISALPDGVELVARTLDLQAAFQEYMVPSVTIENMDPVEVVEVFERVNTTGTKLDAVDFMRAVTWSPSFDLNDQLSLIAGELHREGFKVPEETIAKTIAVVAGREPNARSILGLRLMLPEALREHSDKAKSACLEVCKFLRDERRLISYDLLPYEGQWIVLADLFASRKMEQPWLRTYASRWLWALSFNEGLRGKPDHYISRTLNAFRSAAAADELPPIRLDIQANTLKDRRFTKGKALSAGFAGMFCARGPLSIADARPLADVIAASGASPDAFYPLFTHAELRGVSAHQTSSRVFANLVYVSSRDGPSLEVLGVLGTLERLKAAVGSDGKYREVLDSQFLPHDILARLKVGDVGSLVDERASTLIDGMRELAEGTK